MNLRLDRNHQRKSDPERRTFTNAGAISYSFTSVKFDKMPNDRQSQTKTAVCASCRPVCLPKAIKYMGKEFGMDPRAGIADRDLQTRVDTLQTNIYLSTCGRELDSVGYEIPNHLLQPLLIAHHHSNRGC